MDLRLSRERQRQIEKTLDMGTLVVPREDALDLLRELLAVRGLVNALAARMLGQESALVQYFGTELGRAVEPE